MTVSDRAVRSFHGKQGGPTDILEAWVFLREVHRLSRRNFFFFFFSYPHVFVPLTLTNTVVGLGKKTTKKQQQKKKHSKHAKKKQRKLGINVSKRITATNVYSIFVCQKIKNNFKKKKEQSSQAVLVLQKESLPIPSASCGNLSTSCLFSLLTTNLLARAFCRNGNCFAWQEIILKQNNGSSREIWQQGLTFGSPCLLPQLIYVSRLCSVLHQEEVLQENQI